MGIAVVSNDVALGRRAARACHNNNVAVVALECRGAGHADLGAALDAAARRQDVAAVLVYAGAIVDHAAFAAVCKQAAPHVPILFVCAERPVDDAAFDFYFEAWVGSLGALWCDSLASAVAALSVVRALDPPMDVRCAVLGAEPALVAASATQCRSEGFEVRSTVEADGSHAALKAALSNLQHDLVVATIDEESSDAESMQSLLAARREHPDLPLIVVADGTMEWRRLLAAELAGVGSTTVVDGDVDIGVGLRMLAAWSRVHARAGVGGVRLRDAGRLRRALYTLRGDGVLPFGPDVQGELAGGLGLPYPRAHKAGYLDDVLFAAADYGYPVWVAAVHDDLRWPDTPRWGLARNSDELIKVGERALADAQRALGRRVEVMVTEALPSAVEVQVRVVRHPDYGIVARVCSGVVEGTLIPPFAAADVARALRPMSASDPLIEGVHSCASACVAALEMSEDLSAIEVLLDVGSAGFMTRHASALQERT